MLGSIGAASAVAAVWIPALAALALAAVLGALFVIRRRRRAACHSGPAPVVDLGMPAAAPAAVKVPASGAEQ
ncbi:hypothetical protein ABZV34_33895 [Streptomyces sp. NPDC005195]|uniref:hypothetical protein n=1 Tax=Streptomyces sp. NPDC005195 TaxID=3154561 RepID=UPI0033A98BEC